MSTEQQFLDRIADCPGDDTPWLLYADWLEEHGVPERATGIRAAMVVREAMRAVAPSIEAFVRVVFSAACQHIEMLAAAVLTSAAGPTVRSGPNP